MLILRQMERNIIVHPLHQTVEMRSGILPWFSVGLPIRWRDRARDSPTFTSRCCTGEAGREIRLHSPADAAQVRGKGGGLGEGGDEGVNSWTGGRD